MDLQTLGQSIYRDNYIDNENAPALTHLPCICHSCFWHTDVIILFYFGVMTSFCDVTRRHIIGQDILSGH